MAQLHVLCHHSGQEGRGQAPGRSWGDFRSGGAEPVPGSPPLSVHRPELPGLWEDLGGPGVLPSGDGAGSAFPVHLAAVTAADFVHSSAPLGNARGVGLHPGPPSRLLLTLVPPPPTQGVSICATTAA